MIQGATDATVSAPEHRPNRTILETDRGFVRRCTCCDRIELRFGNALLGLSVDEMECVRSRLVEAELAAGALVSPRPSVVLMIGETASGWVFDREEVLELHRLLAGASLMLDLAG